MSTEKYSLKIISFVLMSNHFHLMLHTPHANLGIAMNYFMRETSRAVARASGRINHVFGARYKAVLITKDSHLQNAYKYVYRNPVEAGACSRVEEYEFSSLQWLLYPNPKREFTLDDSYAIEHMRAPDLMEKRLEWLNQPYSKPQIEVIRRGLRRLIFSYPKGNDYRSAVSTLSNI